MADDDVSGEEMRWFRPHRDEIDAVLGDQVLDEDLADVAAVVHDLRSAYLRGEPMQRTVALQAFTAAPLDDNGDPLVTAASNADGSAPQMAGLPNRENPTGGNKKMLTAASALVTTVAGKVVLGTAIAAASVGGLHAADVVTVPGLPDAAEEQVVTATEREGADTEGADTEDAGEPADEASEGQETAEAAQAKHEAAAEFTAAMEEWSDCVEAAGDDQQAREACGERPHPRDFGLTEPPTDRDGDRGAPEDTPAADRATEGQDNDPTDRATEGQDNDPTDRGTNTPAPVPPSEGQENDPTDQGATTPAPDAADEGQDNDPTDQGTNVPQRPNA